MRIAYAAFLFCLVLWPECAKPEAAPPVELTETKDAYQAAGKYLKIAFARSNPQPTSIAVDGLGGGRFPPGDLLPPPPAPRPTVSGRAGNQIEYRRSGASADDPARWTFAFDARGLSMVSRWSPDDPPEAVRWKFNLRTSNATLLGLPDSQGGIKLPAVLHVPDQGTLRITAGEKEAAAFSLGYDAGRADGEWAEIVFPPANEKQPLIEYRLQVVNIHPALPGVETDRRFDGFRRNWLNILQFNPRLGMLSNHSASDTVALCYYEYADIARHTPPLADGLDAVSLIRVNLDRILAGATTYAMPGYRFFDQNRDTPYTHASLDTYPSLLISARQYVEGCNDEAWLRANYAGLCGWADRLLAADRDGNGLIEYHMSGNSNSWIDATTGKTKTNPSNWWDCIGFGHEDAYSNALAYRALGDTAKLAASIGNDADAARYRAAAKKLHAAYCKTFYNPDTGVLAGWRSADGQLHDYYFLFVNGIAIHYGLVERDRANAIMDRLLAKMKEVGYARFDLGLPGNLIPVAKKDYTSRQLRHGCGVKEDNSDGFQIYENGGATACFAYFTLAALYDLGRREEADRILFPILESIEKGSFRGRNPKTNRSRDWKTWTGEPRGYEGLLVDNYYVLLAVLAREKCLSRQPAANYQ